MVTCILTFFYFSPQYQIDICQVKNQATLQNKYLTKEHFHLNRMFQMKCVRSRNNPGYHILFSDFFNNISVHLKYKRSDPGSMSSPIHQNSSMPSNSSNLIPAHINSQVGAIRTHQTVQQKPQNNLQAAVNRNIEQPFATALSNLAKQKDGKEEETAQSIIENKSSNLRNDKDEIGRHQSRTNYLDQNRSDSRNVSSPQPPEKKVQNKQR